MHITKYKSRTHTVQYIGDTLKIDWKLGPFREAGPVEASLIHQKPLQSEPSVSSSESKETFGFSYKINKKTIPIY
jgi:hypothetical protein